MTISNVGTADLIWDITELPAFAPIASQSPIAHQPSVFVAPDVVTDASQCGLYENYAGVEPDGYAQHCLGMAPQAQTAEASSFDPTDLGFAHDIRNTDNFVSYILNDFPGQTPIGTNPAVTYWGMDFDPSATVLYAIEDNGNSTSPDTLGTIDLATGAYTSISTITNPNGGIFTGLAIDHTDGTFYVSDVTQLFTVDPGTGTVTLVGSFGTTGNGIIDIDISPSGQMYGHDLGDDSIYTIDKTTGVATLVGPTGLNVNFAQGMTFDNADGTLYVFAYTGGGTNTYGTVDLNTGAVTPLAQDNPLGEFEGATQTIAPVACDGDISWASASPISGTTSIGTASAVDVTFDSTGLAPGVYTGTLCVNSNDPLNSRVTVPLTMTVLPNGIPVAADDSYSTGQDAALTVAAPGVLGNDVDGDGDTLTAVLDSDVSDGTLALSADGSFTYTPDTGFTGTDSFTYHANDGTDDSNVATVTITVNAAPVAADDAYTVDQDTMLAAAAPGVLDNDSDADGDALTAVLDTDVSNGTLILNADGSFDYTPDAGFTGTDSFTYHANDGTDDSNVATVTITVEAVGYTIYLPFIVKD